MDVGAVRRHGISLTQKKQRQTVTVSNKPVEKHDDNAAQFLLSFTITALLGSGQEGKKKERI